MVIIPDAFSQIDTLVEHARQEHKIPGIAVAISDTTQTRYTLNNGFANLDAQQPLTSNTLFEIGSIGKSFTAIALLQLLQAGKIDLHQPVQTYLPWFSAPPWGHQITLHHLLTHTAGIPTGSDFTGEPTYEVYALREHVGTLEPGTSWHYSNLGYKTLGLIIEAVTGKPYAQVIQEYILTPLGMSATAAAITHDIRSHLAVGYTPIADDRPTPPDRSLVPATWLETNTADGCIASTADDMAAYTRFFLNKGVGLISPELFTLMTTPHWQYNPENGYGYGLSLQNHKGEQIIGHGGGMVGYLSAFVAASGVGVVVLMNTTHGQPEKLAGQIWRTVTDQPAPVDTPPDFSPYIGTFISTTDDEAPLTVEQTDSGLALRIGHRSVPLYMRGNGNFYADDDNFRHFLFQFEAGEAESITLLHIGERTYYQENPKPPFVPVYLPEWETFTGHYRAHNPWYSNFRVLLRCGKLILAHPDGTTEALTPLDNGWFRIGDSPETICFNTILNGKTMRAITAGEAYYRFFTP